MSSEVTRININKPTRGNIYPHALILSCDLIHVINISLVNAVCRETKVDIQTREEKKPHMEGIMVALYET